MPNPSPQAKVPSKMVVRYGYVFDRTTETELSIELKFYSGYKTLPKPTGHSREYHFTRAFKMLWPQFEWHEWCELMIWAWCNYRLICVIGCTRASKTFFTSHLVLLDYLAADNTTATTLTTTKFDALKARMWGDMMRAAESMPPQLSENFQKNFKITSTTNEMKVVAISNGQHASDKFMIQGVATDSADKAAGKLRGQHADRRRIIVDEAQDVADSIYTAFSNAMSAPDFVGVLLSNPVEKLSAFGDWCKPKGGWHTITESTVKWETDKPDGICLHFDGLQSPNIKAGKDIYPFLFTQKYCDNIRDTFGENSVQWWMYVRGFFPPDGVVSRVWPSSAIEKAEISVEFDYQPQGVASLDPAFEHDDCILTLGKMGKLRDGKSCICATEAIKIQTSSGDGLKPKEYQIAEEVIRICKERNIAPDNFIQDTTGNGRGVFGVMQVEWSPKIHGISYAGEATDRPMRLNDSKPAKEQVKYFVAELWFRASFLASEGMLCGLKNLSTRTRDDLASRRYEVKKHLMEVETKNDMKARLNHSPDYGDSFVQFGELMIRKGLLGDIPGVKKLNKWDHFKKLAKKASSRYSESAEYAHN